MMLKKSHKLAFITVNYNGLLDTKELILSINEAHLTMDYVLVVIDNGSIVDEWEVLKQEFPEILGCRSDKNLGFAGGNNLGLTFVDADYFYFINNDTLLPADANEQINGMLEFLENNPKVGGLTPKLKYVEEPNLLQFAGCTDLSKITIRNRQIGYREIDKGQYQDKIKIPYLHGAAMLIPGRVIAEVGPMPEFYFLYYEELDWCYSICQKYELYYYPEACIQHKESASTGLDSPFKTYYLSRNRLIYSFRNRKGIVRMISMLYLMLMTVFKAFLFQIKGLKKHASESLRGLKDALIWVYS